MKISSLIFISCILVSLLSACQQKKESGTAEGVQDKSTSRPAQLPFLQSVDVNTLYSIVQSVDILFYKLPISVSQDDPASAKNSVQYIVPALPAISSKCEAVGRMSWISDGKIVREADFFVGQGCNYFEFMENDQPAYRNAMAPAGVEFFTTIMSQAKAAVK
jgi:hypothetical protein